MSFDAQKFTPEGLLMFNYLFDKDVGKQYSSNKFSITLRLFNESADKMLALLDELKPQAIAKILEEDPAVDTDKIRIPGRKATTKDDNGKKILVEGAYDFEFKSGYKPVVVDGQKNRITEKSLPKYKAGGFLGEGKIAFLPFAYPGLGGGLSLRLQAVQLTKFGSGSGGEPDISGFDVVDDGFVADTTVETESDTDELPDFAS